ncbi:MAG TPA: 3-dehydroquinate synthase [Magnetospirillaceae bacterium]|nr:3-dehydroquinate synthase [Magnetospirillaceae bacterium]
MNALPPDSTVRLDLGERSYDIQVGAGLLARAGSLIRPLIKLPHLFVVADEKVASLHQDKLAASLDAAGISHELYRVPQGEGSKSFARLEHLLSAILDTRPERSTALLAFGGGVVGDLTGFAAAILLRGVPFIQIPTTLLSQVDSSVGGKTGINMAQGKNLVGAFHQPRLVLADIDLLGTLPRRELASGYAEVVKYGLIDDPDFFSWLEAHGPALLAGDAEARAYAVRHSCQAKARIVAGDEREAGARALLNLGHTFGHALEAETGFSTKLYHGEAVALGCLMAFDLSVRMGICPATDLARARAHFEACGMPVRLPVLEGGWKSERFLEHFTHDKKVDQGRLTFILARGIGQSFVSRDVPQETLRAVLKDWSEAAR